MKYLTEKDAVKLVPEILEDFTPDLNFGFRLNDNNTLTVVEVLEPYGVFELKIYDLNDKN